MYKSLIPLLPIWKCGCGYGTVVERPYCPKCHDLLQPFSTSPLGVVLSWTIIHVTPSGETEPYGLAMVGLDIGINAMAKFEHGKIPEIGNKVAIEIHEDGLRWIKYLPDTPLSDK